MIGLSSQMYMQPMSSQNQNTSQGDHIQGGQTDESQSHSVFDHRKRPLNDVNNPSAKRSHLDPVTEESLAREGNLAHDPSVVGAPWPMHGDYRAQGLAPIGSGLDSGLTGEERHEYFPDYGHMRVQVPVSHPLDSHLHSLSHEGVPQHLLVAPMSMPMTMPYAMTTAPAESHSPKARVKTSKTASKATGIPEPNFIFLVPSVAGRPAHLSHAVAFGKCHFEGHCSMGCQKFKPQPGNYDICQLCGHDEGFHEQLFREDDPTTVAHLAAEHEHAGNGGFAVVPPHPPHAQMAPRPHGPRPPPALTAAQANSASGLRGKRGPYNVKEKKRDKREERETNMALSALGPEALSDAKARRQTEKFLHVLTLRDLSEKCRQLGVSPHGTKDKLVQRLLQAGYRHHKKREGDQFAFGEFPHGVPPMGPMGVPMGPMGQPMLLDPSMGGMLGGMVLDAHGMPIDAHGMPIDGQALPPGFDTRGPPMSWAGVPMTGLPPGATAPHAGGMSMAGMGLGAMPGMSAQQMAAGGEGEGAGAGVSHLGDMGHAHAQGMQGQGQGESSWAPHQ